MRIDEFINALQEASKSYGDLDINIASEEWVEKINEIQLIKQNAITNPEYEYIYMNFSSTTPIERD